MDIIFTLLLLYYLPTILTVLVMLGIWALIVCLLPFIALFALCYALYHLPAWKRAYDLAAPQRKYGGNLLPHVRDCRCADCRSSEEGYRLNHPPDPVQPALPVRALTVRDADDWNPYDRSSWSS